MKKVIRKMDLTRFLRRKGWTQRELSEKIDCSLGLVGGWANHSGVPSYEKCIELLQVGITISELFGEEIAKESRLFPITEEELILNTTNFEQKVGEAFIKLNNSGFFKLHKGEIIL